METISFSTSGAYRDATLVERPKLKMTRTLDGHHGGAFAF